MKEIIAGIIIWQALCTLAAFVIRKDEKFELFCMGIWGIIFGFFYQFILKESDKK